MIINDVSRLISEVMPQLVASLTVINYALRVINYAPSVINYAPKEHLQCSCHS